VNSTVSPPRPPYGLEPTTFPFPALASLAGRAPLGGPRELALACLLVARVVRDSCDAADCGHALSAEQRQQRAAGVKQWLGSAAVSGPVRGALVKLAEATAGTDRSAIKAGLGTVMAITANQLDPSARLELDRLAQAVAE
jgi:hypothetical protein